MNIMCMLSALLYRVCGFIILYVLLTANLQTSESGVLTLMMLVLFSMARQEDTMAMLYEQRASNG